MCVCVYGSECSVGGRGSDPPVQYRVVPRQEAPTFHLDTRGYQAICLQRPGRLNDNTEFRNDLRSDFRTDLCNDFRNDLRSRLEESALTPAAKRPAQQEEAHDPRLPPPTPPGANIKITSRGECPPHYSCTKHIT